MLSDSISRTVCFRAIPCKEQTNAGRDLDSKYRYTITFGVSAWFVPAMMLPQVQVGSIECSPGAVGDWVCGSLRNAVQVLSDMKMSISAGSALGHIIE